MVMMMGSLSQPSVYANHRDGVGQCMSIDRVGRQGPGKSFHNIWNKSYKQVSRTENCSQR